MPTKLHKIGLPSLEEKPPLKKTKKASESILASSRRVTTLNQKVPKHPLGIKPLGNQILASSQDLQKIGNSAGKLFNALSDDIILLILSMLTKDDLANASRVSKFWYAYATFDDLWRKMYTSVSAERRLELGIEFTRWRGTWRASILNLKESMTSIDCTGIVYSDALFTPYSNSCINYQEIFRDLIKEQENLRDIDGYWDANVLDNPSQFPYRGRIPRIEESTFTYEHFVNNHWNDHPFILGSRKSDNGRWPQWTTKYLLERFPDVKFRQESVLWELSLYESYTLQNHDESPLYLFDCRSDAMKALLPTGYFENPPIFAREDLFKVFEECRPDHSWLIAGPARSGSTFHKDPNSTDAWNVVLEGSKLWVMLPPEMKPPGVFVSDDESEVMSPEGLAEWVKSGFWNDSIQLSDEANSDNNDKYGSAGFRTCVVGITFKNECMYVPSGWWHTVINLEDSVAFTANFVPPCKIGPVLSFMKNKRAQVSGFRHDLFHQKLSSFLKTQDIKNSENKSTLIKYLSMEELKNNDEDVGELKDTGCMPVYEAFIEFLLAKGMKDIVDKGLRELQTVAAAKQERSQVWENLTKDAKSGKTSGFSFGFDIGDDDE